MKIKYWMTKKPLTCSPSTTIFEAARIMKQHNFRRLPVMEGSQLVGLVTDRNILEAQPSSVSTLSKQEARYLMASLVVGDVMRRAPLTVTPEDNVITAMIEGNRKGIGCYPVVENQELVGIITYTDLFDLVVHILGAKNQDDLIYLMENTEKLKNINYLPNLVSVLQNKGIAIENYLLCPHREAPDSSIILLKVSSGLRPDATEALTTNGYQLFANGRP